MQNGKLKCLSLFGSREEYMEQDATARVEIDAIIEEPGGWRTRVLREIREIIGQAAPHAIEAVKWRKPSKPLGVVVWVQGGNLCIAEALKNAVRISFPKGSLLNDPASLFNARLTGTSVRAIDVHEGDTLNAAALGALVQEAVKASG